MARSSTIIRSLAGTYRLAVLTLLLGALPLSASVSHAQNPALGGGQRHRNIEPTCPPGSVLVNGRCGVPQVQQQCPPGTVGAYPTCRPAVRSFCPQGTLGVYPNCRPTLNLPPPLDERL